MDLYNIETKNLLLDAPVPLLSGYKSMMINAGKLIIKVLRLLLLHIIYKQKTLHGVQI